MDGTYSDNSTLRTIQNLNHVFNVQVDMANDRQTKYHTVQECELGKNAKKIYIVYI